MIIHEVRQPFLCREGQFEEDKRTLCIGLDYNTIKSTKEFRCYLGSNKKVCYEIESAAALKIGQTWKNPKGKTVMIVPLNAFTIVRSSWDQEEYDKKEAVRAKINGEKQLSLL